jgi:hypothetical protein
MRDQLLIAPQHSTRDVRMLDDFEKQLEFSRLKDILPEPSVEQLAKEPGGSGGIHSAIV